MAEQEILRNQFINLLLQTYMKLREKNFMIKIPEKCLELQREIIDTSDTIGMFLRDTFEKKIGSVLKSREVREIFEENKIKYQAFNVKNRIKEIFDVEFKRDKQVDGIRYIDVFIGLSKK